MPILDFKEIPPPTTRKGKKSNDLDAFEKFAEEFFVEVKGAKLLERCSRGADGGIDLKIEYKGEMCLVSCKHYAHSGESVRNEVTDAGLINLLIRHKCKKFIGFYSTITSSNFYKIISENFKDDNEAVKLCGLSYELYFSSDIESAMLNVNNPRGWLLAMRYFPNSYINLFQRFFTPIEYYNEHSKELKKKGNGYRLDGPFGKFSNRPKAEIIKEANDDLTSELHSYFFYLAIQDAINLFPYYFVYRKNSNLDRLSVNDISPAWNNILDNEYGKNTISCDIPTVVCGIWSMWDYEKATKKLMEYRESTLSYPRFITKGPCKYILESEIPYSNLNFGYISLRLNSELRNLFARLVAFCPAGGAKTNLNITTDGTTDDVVNFDPDKTGKSNIKWGLDLSNLEGYKWLQERLKDKNEKE